MRFLGVFSSETLINLVPHCPYPEDVHQVVLTEILGSKDPDYLGVLSFFFFQFHKPLQYLCFVF